MLAKNIDLRLCNIVVYYRDIPAILLAVVAKDGKMSYSKNGIVTKDGKSNPRLTVHIDTTGNESTDKKRVKEIVELLEELEANNQIISFSGQASRWS